MGWMDKEISNSVFSSVRQSWAHQADLEEPGDFVALVSRVRPQLDTEFNKIRFGMMCQSWTWNSDVHHEHPVQEKQGLANTDVCGQPRAPVSHVLERCHVAVLP